LLQDEHPGEPAPLDRTARTGRRRGSAGVSFEKISITPPSAAVQVPSGNAHADRAIDGYQTSDGSFGLQPIARAATPAWPASG